MDNLTIKLNQIVEDIKKYAPQEGDFMAPCCRDTKNTQNLKNSQPNPWKDRLDTGMAMILALGNRLSSSCPDNWIITSKNINSGYKVFKHTDYDNNSLLSLHAAFLWVRRDNN